MHSSHILKAVALALTTFSVAHASLEDPRAFEIAEAGQIVKRQSEADPSTSSSSSRTSTTSSSSSSRAPTTTTPTTAPTTRTTAPTSTSTAPSTSNAQTTPAQTTPAPTTSTTSSEQSKTSAESTTSQTTITTVVTFTDSNGSITTQTSEIVQATTVPSSSNSENKGMDKKTRDIIIGVAVGVGGAIVFAVVGLVAWRIWGRKKNQEEADNSFGSQSYAATDKPEPTSSSTNSRTPFQSTLESYHAPTQVNTASNF